MKASLLFLAGVAFVSLTGSVYGGEGCHGAKKTGYQKSEASMQEIKMDAKVSKYDKMSAYKEKYQDVSYSEVVEATKSNKVLILDANKLETYQKSHIKNAVNFYDTKALAKALPADKDALIITYCGSPKCTAWTKAADYVSAQGYTNVKHFSGGIKEWLARAEDRKEKTKQS